MMIDALKKLACKLLFTSLLMGLAILLYAVAYGFLPLAFAIFVAGLLVLSVNSLCGYLLDEGIVHSACEDESDVPAMVTTIHHAPLHSADIYRAA